MLPISPTELAQLLQLSPGSDGTASIVAQESMREAMQRLSSFTFAEDSAEQVQESYTEEFWSQYLPSFLRSMLAGGKVQSLYFLKFYQWMCAGSRTSLDRYTRANPQDACELYLWEADMLAWQAERHDSLLVDENGIYSLIQSTMSFINSFVYSVPQLPPSVAMPCLPARSKAGLLAVASVCKDDPRISKSEAWGSEDHHCTTAITVLTALALASDTDMREQQSVWSWRSDGTFDHWWACELGGSSTASSDCTKMKDGYQMMACSRCIAVRYCSREHQKADWKRHKLVCFKPSW